MECKNNLFFNMFSKPSSNGYIMGSETFPMLFALKSIAYPIRVISFVKPSSHNSILLHINAFSRKLISTKLAHLYNKWSQWEA